ncbi:MAG: preprotein translocase subunit SecE [Candidatus Coatesbacteria bacterium]|nr:preprotein translocase subunit SecE [Candidatus Coatesbacteria bacterium]
MSRIITFFRDVHLELKRVTWPNKDQIISATAVVIIATLIISAYLGLIDNVLALILQFVLK